MDLVQQLDSWDRAAFTALNGLHSSFWDPIMWQISALETWVPLYVFFLYLIHRFYGWRGLAWAVPVIGLLLVGTDTGSVVLFKNTVQRLRPSHVDALNGSIHLLMGDDGQLYRGGQYGFVSSHASNHFGIAIFMAVALHGLRKWITPLLILWAMLVAYSRIYIGVHYPGDVLVGAIYGSAIGLASAALYRTVLRRVDILPLTART